MRIGIVGDTHGDLFSLRQAAAAADPVDLWLHTGDFCRDALQLAGISGRPVTAVAGNCDGRADAKPDEFIETGGFRIWLTHGHRQDVKHGLEDLLFWARRYEADIVVFGHTHQADVRCEGDLLLFNPGSAAIPRRGKHKSCGVLELDPDRHEATPRILTIP